MGCDIHYVLEKKVGEKWVGVFSTGYIMNAPVVKGNKLMNPYKRPLPKQRNYWFFAELAGVRGESSKNRVPLGAPDDASDLTRMELDKWSGDAHSASHLSVYEFCQAWLDAQLKIVESYYESVKQIKIDADKYKDSPETKKNITRVYKSAYKREKMILETIAKDLDTAIYWLFDLEEYQLEESEFRVVFWFDN